MYKALRRDLDLVLKLEEVEVPVIIHLKEKMTDDLARSRLDLELQLIMMSTMAIDFEDADTVEHSFCRNSIESSPCKPSKKKRDSIMTLVSSPGQDITKEEFSMDPDFESKESE